MSGNDSVDGRLSPNSDNSDLLFCTPCKSDNTLVHADGFCKSCREHLCTSCIAFHRKLRLTKDHFIVGIRDAENPMPANSNTETAVAENIVCDKHKDELIKFYCRNHSVTGCGVCTTFEHRSCQLDYIPDVAINFKETSEYKTLLESINNLDENAQQFKEQLGEKQKEVEEINDEAVTSVRKIHKKLIDHLNDQESRLLSQSSDFNKGNQLKIAQARTSNLQIREQITDLNSKLKKWENHPQKLFVVAKAIDNEYRDLGTNFANLTESFDIERYSFRPNLKMTSTDLFPLGEIKPLATYKMEPKIDLSSVQVKCYNLTLPEDEQSPLITGIACLPMNRILIADSDNMVVKVFDVSSEKITSNLILQGKPWDVTGLEMDQAAVTIPDKNRVEILATDGELSSVRGFTVDGTCYGISYNGKKLYVVCQSPARIFVLDIYGTVLKNVNIDTPNAQYLAVSLRPDKQTVYISYRDGNIQKVEMDNDFLLEKAEKVQLDGSTGIVIIGGKWLICCNYKLGMNLLTERDSKLSLIRKWKCLEYTRAIDFCPDNTLYVSFDSKFLSIYNILTWHACVVTVTKALTFFKSVPDMTRNIMTTLRKST